MAEKFLKRGFSMSYRTRLLKYQKKKKNPTVILST